MDTAQAERQLQTAREYLERLKTTRIQQETQKGTMEEQITAKMTSLREQYGITTVKGLEDLIEEKERAVQEKLNQIRLVMNPQPEGQ